MMPLRLAAGFHLAGKLIKTKVTRVIMIMSVFMIVFVDQDKRDVSDRMPAI